MADPVSQPPSALPHGTRLGEFELRQVLGIGGFGIVYLAFDHDLEREVAVKEYMPESMAGRTATMHVSLRSQSDAETFALGLRSFVNEARLLARFDHPSLVKVYRFWEANGTAYMAMPVYRGSHLKKIYAGMRQPPDEAWLRGLLMPLLSAIECLHNEGVFHRDIAPDNIQIEPDGRPVLLDFGAARRVISDRSQNLTAILKPAYAPIEQYAEGTSVRQGPWTDLYSLGATLHYMLLGRPPAPATTRTVHDDMVPLAGLNLPGCSKSFLACVDWMLAPKPNDRPQSVAALRDVLEGRAALPEPAPVVAAGYERTQRIRPSADDTVVARRPRIQPLLDSAAQAPVAKPMSAPAPAPAPARRNGWWAAGLALLVVAGGAAFWIGSRPVVPPAPALAQQTVPPSSAPVPPPVIEPAPLATTPAAVVAPAPSPSTSPPAASSTPVQGVAASPKPTPVPTTAQQRAAAVAAAKAREPVDSAARTAPQPLPSTQASPPQATNETPNRPARVPAVNPTGPTGPTVVATPTAAVASSPTERCGKRVLFSMWICVERECANPEFRNHSECVKLRADQARRAAAEPGSR